jgi:hypothetical protein
MKKHKLIELFNEIIKINELILTDQINNITKNDIIHNIIAIKDINIKLNTNINQLI